MINGFSIRFDPDLDGCSDLISFSYLMFFSFLTNSILPVNRIDAREVFLISSAVLF